MSLRATPRWTISRAWLSYTVACWVFFPSLRSVEYSMARAIRLLSGRSAGSLIHGYSACLQRQTSCFLYQAELFFFFDAVVSTSDSTMSAFTASTTRNTFNAKIFYFVEVFYFYNMLHSSVTEVMFFYFVFYRRACSSDTRPNRFWSNEGVQRSVFFESDMQHTHNQSRRQRVPLIA